MRCAWPLVLLLAIEPTAAFAQSLVCHPIRRGETAAQVARRVTGDGRNAYRPWFEIRNASARSVPKSQYNRIRAGWQACYKPALQRAAAKVEIISASEIRDSAEAPTSPVTTAALVAPVARLEPAVMVTGKTVEDEGEGSDSVASRALRAIGALDLTMVWLGAAMFVPWVGWRLVDGHLTRKKTMTLVMRHFATRFVREFERPLLWSDVADRPVRSRVRYNALRGRLEILLAPGKGRRYPNLSDHKKNMEYDVARVVTTLNDASFVNGKLHMHEGWVVVPFRFKTGPKQPGVTCISSF
jgi:hypothetical protein